MEQGSFLRSETGLEKEGNQENGPKILIKRCEGCQSTNSIDGSHQQGVHHVDRRKQFVSIDNRLSTCSAPSLLRDRHVGKTLRPETK